MSLTLLLIAVRPEHPLDLRLLPVYCVLTTCPKPGEPSRVSKS